MTENEIAKVVVNCSFKIHEALGPGLLESVYEEILSYELKKCCLEFERQKELPIEYEGVKLDIGFRTDIVVEKKVIVEIKSVENLVNIHKKQLLTYLKLSGLRLGLLINFNEAYIKYGIKRVVNGLEE